MTLKVKPHLTPSATWLWHYKNWIISLESEMSTMLFGLAFIFVFREAISSFPREQLVWQTLIFHPLAFGHQFYFQLDWREVREHTPPMGLEWALSLLSRSRQIHHSLWSQYQLFNSLAAVRWHSVDQRQNFPFFRVSKLHTVGTKFRNGGLPFSMVFVNTNRLNRVTHLSTRVRTTPKVELLYEWMRLEILLPGVC